MTIPTSPSISSNWMIRTLIAIAFCINIQTTVLATIPPINDKCSNAANVTTLLNEMLPFAGRVNTKYATTDFSNTTCSITSTDIGVWYTVTGNNQNIDIDVTRLGGDTSSIRNGGIEVSLFGGTCNNLICLKSVSDHTTNPVVNLSWNATIEQQYYIIVAGTSSSTGTYSVTIEVCIEFLFHVVSFVPILQVIFSGIAL